MKIKPEYQPVSDQQKLGYLIEECGEVLAAAGKSMRWGFHSINPELPPEAQERNGAWLMREMRDLQRGIAMVQEILFEQGYSAYEVYDDHGEPAKTTSKPPIAGENIGKNND